MLGQKKQEKERHMKGNNMGRDYDGDLAAALLKQSELIKRQVIL